MVGFFNYLKTEYEILTGSVPTVMKTASEIRQEQLDFATDDFYLDDKGIIDLDPEVGGRDATNFNYKVKVKVENDSSVIAELDSDSHISLISESYFNRLSELTEIKYCEGHPSHAPSVRILNFKLIEKMTWTLSTSILFGFNTYSPGLEMHGKTLI